MIDLKDYIVESLLDNKLLKPLRDFIQRNFKKRVGFKEMITVCIQGDKYEFTATIDTGNGGVVPTLGVDKMNIDGDKVTITIGDKEYTFDKKGEASPTVGNVVHHRPIIIIDYIKIGGRKLDEPFIAVTDERKKSTKTLINRDTMSKLNLVVDPSKNNLIHEKLRINNDTKLDNRLLDDELEEWVKPIEDFVKDNITLDEKYYDINCIKEDWPKGPLNKIQFATGVITIHRKELEELPEKLKKFFDDNNIKNEIISNMIDNTTKSFLIYIELYK